MNIVMPMAGLGKRLTDYGYATPKPLIEVLRKILVEWAISSIGIKGNFPSAWRDLIPGYCNPSKPLHNQAAWPPAGRRALPPRKGLVSLLIR